MPAHSQHLAFGACHASRHEGKYGGDLTIGAVTVLGTITTAASACGAAPVPWSVRRTAVDPRLLIDLRFQAPVAEPTHVEFR